MLCESVNYRLGSRGPTSHSGRRANSPRRLAGTGHVFFYFFLVYKASSSAKPATLRSNSEYGARLLARPGAPAGSFMSAFDLSLIELATRGKGGAWPPILVTAVQGTLGEHTACDRFRWDHVGVLAESHSRKFPTFTFFSAFFFIPHPPPRLRQSATSSTCKTCLTLSSLSPQNTQIRRKPRNYFDPQPPFSSVALSHVHRCPPPSDARLEAATERPSTRRSGRTPRQQCTFDRRDGI